MQMSFSTLLIFTFVMISLFSFLIINLIHLEKLIKKIKPSDAITLPTFDFNLVVGSFAITLSDSYQEF